MSKSEADIRALAAFDYNKWNSVQGVAASREHNRLMPIIDRLLKERAVLREGLERHVRLAESGCIEYNRDDQEHERYASDYLERANGIWADVGEGSHGK